MKLIDFDKHFSDFWVEYFRSHRDEYDFVEEFEDDITEIYDIFLDTRPHGLTIKSLKNTSQAF